MTRELEQTPYNDALVSTRIKAALVDAPEVQAAAIGVRADAQALQVVLSGFVDSTAQAAAAMRLATEAAPQYQIIDELEIR